MLHNRVLNILLTAYQTELFEDYGRPFDPVVHEDVLIVTDLGSRIQRCAVQASRKALDTMVLQERAWWLNLTNLSDREREIETS